MRVLLFILLITLSLQAQALKKDTSTHQESVVVSKQEHRDALQIAQDYKEFIDTKPSKKKKKLAIYIKDEIESFEARYETSPLLPATLKLLVEIDFYLENRPH